LQRSKSISVLFFSYSSSPSSVSWFKVNVFFHKFGTRKADLGSDLIGIGITTFWNEQGCKSW
jgi:hypothetical protein